MVSREVLDACRRGDPDAFEEVVRTTYRAVYTQALRLLRDRHDAEDVTQEVYVRVYRGLAGFRGDASFETWLYRIVANAAMSHLRRRGRLGEVLSDPHELPVAEAAVAGPADGTVDRESLRSALEALPASMRTVVLLKDVYGLSCAEIGRELDVSEGAVKVRLHRARRRLKESLFGAEEEDREV